jgi:hypothetical protein
MTSLTFFQSPSLIDRKNVSVNTNKSKSKPLSSSSEILLKSSHALRKAVNNAMSSTPVNLSSHTDDVDNNSAVFLDGYTSNTGFQVNDYMATTAPAADAARTRELVHKQILQKATSSIEPRADIFREKNEHILNEISAKIISPKSLMTMR